MNKTNHPKKGFTLTELLVAISITAIVGTIVTMLVYHLYLNFGYSRDYLTVQQSARVGLNKMTDEIRQANQINSISSTTIVFYKLEGSDPFPAKVEYILESNELARYHTVAEGVVPNVIYPDYNRKRTVIAQYVTNGSTPLFTVYNDANTVVNYTDLNLIKLIRANLIQDYNSNKKPDPTNLTIDIQLRNFKVN